MRRIGLALLAATALTTVAVNLALPLVLGHTVDALVAGRDGGRWLSLTAGLVAVNVLVGLVDAYAGAAVVASTTSALRHRLLRHLLSVAPDDLAPLGTGELVTRLVSNTADAARAGTSAVMLGVSAVPPIACLGLLAWIDPWLVAAFAAGLALVTLVLRVFARQTGQAMAAYLGVQGGIAARLTESLAGARTIAAAGTWREESRRILRTLPQLHEHGAAVWRVLARSGAQAAIVGPVLQMAVLSVGGLALVAGRITAGDLFAASQYAAIGAGLGGLTGLLGQYARARAGAQRGRELLARPRIHYGQRALSAGPGRLEFQAVTARAGDTRVEIDLTVPGGAAVAVVGPSGAGKSVLAGLAARLRDPDEGRILLDGVALPELSHAALRTAVGCAFTRPALVGTTIADAIAPGDATAARATCAHDFITKLPSSYRTPLAEAPMSGGERQRLGLARAWPAGRLLVLDDATSSLDMVTEMQISRTLTADPRHRTCLIVTHRLRTAARADLVLWLDAGRVRALAPHETLWTDTDYRRVFA